jgi:hypothetical protein
VGLSGRALLFVNRETHTMISASQGRAPGRLFRLAALNALAALAVHAQVGFPGLSIGLAQRYDSQFGARVDVSTIGSQKKNGVQEGVDYEGSAKANRLAVLGDWYPMKGAFRVTAGLTFNDATASLVAQGAGKTFQIGNSQSATTTADDRFNVSVKFPSVMPYVGIGWGHHQTDGAGFLFDLGMSLGKPKVTETHTGPVLGQISQAEYDRELQELRDGVAKISGLPQITLGFSYRF